MQYLGIAPEAAVVCDLLVWEEELGGLGGACVLESQPSPLCPPCRNSWDLCCSPWESRGVFGVFKKESLQKFLQYF